MVQPCADLLVHAPTQLQYHYPFPGTYHSDMHYDAQTHHMVQDGYVEPIQEPASSHGIELNIVGGDSYVDPGTNPELAAAAVNPDEVVVQVDGDSYIVDMD